MRIRPAKANSIRFTSGGVNHVFHAGQWQDVNGEGLDYLLSEYSMYPMVEEKLLGPHWIEYTGVKKTYVSYNDDPNVVHKFNIKPGQYLKLPRHGAYQILKRKDFVYASYVDLAQKFNFKNVLVIRYGGLGDILLTTPAIRELKRLLPNIELHYSTDDRYKSLLQRNKYVDYVWGIEDIYDADIKFDAIVDLRRCVEANKLSADLHRALLFAQRFGIDTLSDYSLEFDGFNLPVKPKSIVLQADGSSGVRSLPPENIIQVADALSQKYDVTLVGSQPFAYTGCRNLAGKLNVEEVMKELATCELVVTGDSGLLHCAVALRKPLVGLFGSVLPELRLPPDYPATVIQASMYSKCLPCNDRQTRGSDCLNCLSAIPIDLIVEKVNRWFDGNSEGK